MKKPAKQNAASRARARDDDEAPAQWMDPRKLKPWPANPRAIDVTDIDRVAKSIERFGFGAPIVVRKANLEIIAGHVRHKAALNLNLARVPVRLLDVSAEDAHILAVADNRYVELVSWKPELGDLLEALDADTRALAGWTDKELERLQDHFIDSGTSKEIDPNDIASTKFTHVCPQCGCEFG